MRSASQSASFVSAGTAVAGAPAATTARRDRRDSATTATLNGTVIRNKRGARPTTSSTARRPPTARRRPRQRSAAMRRQASSSRRTSPVSSRRRPTTSASWRPTPSGTANGADADVHHHRAGHAARQRRARSPLRRRPSRSASRSRSRARSPAGRARRCELEQSPFPYTDPFKNAAQATTDAAGNYTFAVSPALNTRYHATAKSPPATSPDVTVLVRTKVGLRLSDKTPRRGARVRLRGSVLPAHDGSTVRIQRKTSSGWKTIGRRRWRLPRRSTGSRGRSTPSASASAAAAPTGRSCRPIAITRAARPASARAVVH